MSAKNKTILLAEDEESVRKFVSSLLHREGYDVITAETGMEALEKSRRHEADIHLLLSNIQMPGMTGVELATQLKMERPETEILLISGIPAGMIVLDSGWQFLPKPFLPRMLAEKIESMLNHQANQRTPESGGGLS